MMPEGITAELTFLVQGSLPDPYVVKFMMNDGVVSCFCNCKAGAIGGGCKHRYEIMGGNAEAIVSGNGHEVATILDWLQGSNISEHLAAVAAAETALAASKQAVSLARRRLAAACRGD